MKIRLEFGRSPSSSFEWVLRLARGFRGFKKKRDHGQEIYLVDCEEADFQALGALISATWAWRKVAFFVDGQLCSRLEAYSKMAGVLRRQAAAAPALASLKVRWTDRPGS